MVPASFAHKSNILDTSLAATVQVTTLLSNAAKFAPVPYLDIISALKQSILATAQDVRKNNEALQRLAGDAHKLICAAERVDQTTRRNLRDDLDALVVAIKAISGSAPSSRRSHRIWAPWLKHKKIDASTISAYRQKIIQEFDLFALKIQIRVEADIRNISDELENMAPILKCQASQSDVFHERQPSVPAAVQNMLFEHVDSILPVLGVCIAFKQAPSVLQISRVLAIDVNQVISQLGYISAYVGSQFDSTNSLADVELPRDLEQWLVSPEHAGELWIDVSRYHSRIAQWCLVGKRTYDVRDVLYKANNWAFHVCHSDASEELYKALVDSELPSHSTSQSHVKLQCVINWLKSQRDPSQELISAFEALFGKHPGR
ncbi:hypothetical protein MVEN_01655800 [Mycena venus]|uniref:Uncharacterized protein n=1 Tax=Mycena venus TaxID=2733690 RepID=A0A8H6XP65_9AGAR|nr:hypothetical protein MVEN_01655800 [Mycena venus]